MRLERGPGEEGVIEVRVEPLSAGEEPDEFSVSRLPHQGLYDVHVITM